MDSVVKAGDLVWVDTFEGNEFVDKLDEVARDLGLKLAELMAHLGIANSTVVRWTNSSRRPRRSTRRKIRDYVQELEAS